MKQFRQKTTNGPESASTLPGPIAFVPKCPGLAARDALASAPVRP
jgi:hypothetical protein